MKLQPVVSRKADLVPPAKPIVQGEKLVKSQKISVCCLLLHAISKTLQEGTSFASFAGKQKEFINTEPSLGKANRSCTSNNKRGSCTKLFEITSLLALSYINVLSFQGKK